jgi:hypothetical protein
MNPIFNQKYKTTLCRHWLTTQACSIGVRCVFAHGQAELRNPNDPITLNQNILTDPKMLTSFMTTPLGDVAHINAMVSAQQLDALAQEKETLRKALNNTDDREEYRNALSTAKEYLNKPHFDITTDPMVQKRLMTAQMKLIVKEILKLNMHPIIKCKVRICEELLEAENIDSCSIVLNEIMERETASQVEKEAYEVIIDQATQLSIQLIAEEKVKFQRLQKDQEILIRKQHERAQMNTGRFY